MNTSPATPSTTLDYTIHNFDMADPVRHVDLPNGTGSLERLVRDGYVVLPQLFAAGEVAQFRAALDDVAAEEMRAGRTASGSGLFLRWLMDKRPAFLDLLRVPALLSLVRAALGPQVQVRGVSARITRPDETSDGVAWHFHQRLVPEPLPPFFARPHTLDALLYLNDADDANGPLCVLPGSHQHIHAALSGGDDADKPGQILLRPRAGDVAVVHGSTWHRALPGRPDGTVRRLVIIGYGPTWMKPSIYGERPADGLTKQLLKNADEETRELLGAAGYM